MRPGRTAMQQLSLLILLLISGCSPYESSVSGTVSLDGEPLKTGTVTFHKMGGGAAAYSRIAEDGTYSIMTGSESGLQPGEYQITVMAVEIIPAADPGGAPTGRPITPRRYGNLKESDLKFTVESGANQIDLALQSK